MGDHNPAAVSAATGFNCISAAKRPMSIESDPRSSSFCTFSSSPPPTSSPPPVECTMEYLADLVKEKKQLELFPHAFTHVERLVDEEINRVRLAIFQCDFTTSGLSLPEPKGEVVMKTEKLYVPRKDFPEYNFVGRILGPRGMTAKQLEQETGCKIMVRGRGSMRDRRKEEANRGKPNWEHLEDELHVLIQCEDTENRASVKMRAAVEHVKKLLIPAPEGTDELKRKQLMELAIINGTYRPYHGTRTATHTEAQVAAATAAAHQRGLFSTLPMSTLSLSPMRAQAGPTLFLTPSPVSSPTPVSSSLLHSGHVGHSPFDYTNMMNPSFLESLLSSYQLAGMAAAAAASIGGNATNTTSNSDLHINSGMGQSPLSTPRMHSAHGNFFSDSLLGSNSSSNV